MDLDAQQQERRRERLRHWVKAHGGHAKVVEARGLTSSQASYLSQVMNGYSFAFKAARNMETRLGLATMYLDEEQRTETAPHDLGRAQSLSLRPVTVHPVALTWDDLVTAADLPPLFEVPMPDDALAPDVRAGTVLLFGTDDAARPLRPRTGILVQDAAGRRYIRRYAEAPGGRWQAQALDSAYVSLDSERDGLVLLAVMKGRMDPLI